jgi:flagellar motor protein MotB
VQLRAESVRAYLVTDKQIQNERLQAIGKLGTDLMNRANPIPPENRRQHRQFVANEKLS